MINPFETIDSRLTIIENLLLDIKHDRQEAAVAKEETDEILNVHQASKYLNLALPTIYSLVSKRTLTSYKRGKKLYFKRSELTQWVQSGKRTSISELQLKAKSIAQ